MSQTKTKYIQIMNTQILTKKSRACSIGLALLSLAFAACSPTAETATQEAPSASDLNASLFIEQAPKGALSVAEGRVQLAAGDEAVIEGQIGGVLEPFLSGYLGFVLADTEIMFCDEMGDDTHCATPWDACCEDADQLKARRISVQFVDAEGNPLEGDLQSQTSLKGLDHVVVVGTVAETSTPENMIVNARKMARLN
jgi:hypothetical protein